VSSVQKLIPAGPIMRTNFCRRMLQSVHDGIVGPALIFMSNEAWFHLSFSVNAQKTCYWDNENPHTIHEVPLRDQKCVWVCGLWLMVGE
jgi:hypothetical protein